MKVQLFDILSIAAVLSCFVPLILVYFKKRWKDPFFLLFAAYWALGGLINLTDIIPGFPKKASYMTGVFYNMLDVPVILSILYYTSSSAAVKKSTSLGLILISSFEIFSVSINGITYEALKYPLGIGIAMVLVMVIMEIVRYMQDIEHSNHLNSKILVYAAVLFEYATFIVIYIFDYFIETSNSRDSFLIYYISTLVAIFIASCGYLMFKKYDKNTVAY